ncbi:hypothetical protein BHM03_00044650 [Ensete ventricosum]|nr:hypothetical protein BHM03_00044650 [Ensete ventricosum]
MSWSYEGHVIATVPDKSPIAYCRGHCTLVGRYASPDMPPVANCQGVLTSALLRRSLIGGQLVGHRAVRGYPEVSNLAVEEVIGIAHIHRNGDGLLFKESSNFHRLRVGVAG